MFLASSQSKAQDAQNFEGISSGYEKSQVSPYEKRRLLPMRTPAGSSGLNSRPLPTLPLAKTASSSPLSRGRVASSAPPSLPLLDVTSVAPRPQPVRNGASRFQATPSISLRSRPGYVNSVGVPTVQQQPLPDAYYSSPDVSLQPLAPAFTSVPQAVPPAVEAVVPAPPVDTALSSPPTAPFELPPIVPPAATYSEPPVFEAEKALPLPPASSEIAELPVASSSGGNAEVRFFAPDPSQPPVSDAVNGSAPAEQLSEETRAILSSLPADALPRPVPMPSADVKGDFAIKRAIDSTTPFATTSAPVPSVNGEAAMDIRMKPQSIDINYELERAYNALVAGDTDMAIHLYEQVLSIDPSEKTALFGLATTYHRIGLLDQARPVYGRLLAIDPYNVEALNNFFALVGAEAPHAAIEQLELLAYDNPQFAPIQAQIALLYQKLEDYPNAISHMSRAAVISPENLAYKYNLAVLYDTNEQYDQAERIYRYLLTLYRDGQELPASPKAIQERLTFLASN